MAMARRTRSLIIQGLGWIFMVLGVLGLVLPILQGILFLAIGMVLLSSPRLIKFTQAAILKVL